MISHYRDGAWEGFEILPYKDVEGSHRGVSRQNLNKESLTDFEVRTFEVAPGGFTSFEYHLHEHCVFIYRGSGEVQLGDESYPIGPMDMVRVAGNVPHQFRNNGDEPLGILCVVDRMRDRPTLVDPEAELARQNK